MADDVEAIVARVTAQVLKEMRAGEAGRGPAELQQIKDFTRLGGGKAAWEISYKTGKAVSIEQADVNPA